MYEGGTTIHNRKLVLCARTEDWPVPELLKECPQCKCFVLYCCACNNELTSRPKRRRPTKPCHHFRIIFTDGSCAKNGQPEAKAGVGAAFGTSDNSQLGMPITDSVDNFPLRSNQRAELCAAKFGLEIFIEIAEFDTKDQSGKCKGEDEVWIIATDSEYVVKGMTEWLPTWRRNNWRTSKGTKPANLDLFLALDSLITEHEEPKNIKIGFWYIPREHNKLADRLAKAAAVQGDVATT